LILFTFGLVVTARVYPFYDTRSIVPVDGDRPGRPLPA
jgi:hypothetical protein